MTASPWPWCVAMLAIAAGCGTSTFECQSDEQCSPGECLVDGYCGFPADDCPSGLRYGDHSGPLSGECVPRADTDSAAEGTTHAESSSGAPTATMFPSTSTAAETLSTTVPVTTATSNVSATDTSGGSTTEAPIDESLVLWLDFEGAEDTWLEDRSAFGNHGSCTDLSCPSPGEGVIGAGARFSGASVVTVPHADSLATPMGFTLAAWHRVAELPDTQRAIISKPVGVLALSSWALYYYSTGGCFDCPIFAMAGGTVQTPSPIAIGEWVHLAATWDGAAMSLYVGGEFVVAQAVGALQMDEQPVLVGADDDHQPIGLDGYFIGTIDEVRIYERALSDDEILVLAQTP